jgi:hypothetical protein
VHATDIPGFRKSAWFGEQVHEQWFNSGARVRIIAPGNFDPHKPTSLVFFATPNGNTLEQTLGCVTTGNTDWHFDIQHVAAQVRRFREVTPDAQVVLACLEAEGLSWPAWKAHRQDGPRQSRSLVEVIRQLIPAKDVSITLSGHSGGGSFLFRFIDAVEAIPDEVARIVFLDANYNYSEAAGHGDKFVAWLKKDETHRLVVIAYDDRKITLNGKLVLSPTGGTYRSTERMRDGFARRNITLTETVAGDFRVLRGMNGQIAMMIHRNPQNKILHTVLVGEMNGLLRGLSDGAEHEPWGDFGGPRAYTKWIQPAPTIPDRPADAVVGSTFLKSLEGLSRSAREEAVANEIVRGNFPQFLRKFKAVTLTGMDADGKQSTAIVEVMPDYLAVGSDDDFVRMPMDPRTACRIAEAFGCSLPTRKIVDAVYTSAEVKLQPRPLTEARESLATFVEHNQIIEAQRRGSPLGELVAGIKKDVVLSNRLEEKADRVAIYGWHLPNGKPIQPLTIVHVNWYVDYSHGARLVKRQIEIDGKPHDLRTVLFSSKWSPLVSDEGPIRRIDY